jgi:hypothetical protein
VTVEGLVLDLLQPDGGERVQQAAALGLKMDPRAESAVVLMDDGGEVVGRVLLRCQCCCADALERLVEDIGETSVAVTIYSTRDTFASDVRARLRDVPPGATVH